MVKGSSLEKFINMATARGIHLWDIKRIGKDNMVVKTRLLGVKALRHIAREINNGFRIQCRRGLPFVVQRVKKNANYCF